MTYRAMLLLAMCAATPAPGSGAASAPPVKHCATAEYRQFDFWVGSWEVYPTGRSQLVAHSLIERVYNGCGVRENWMPLKTQNSGGSLNIYLPGEKLWRQTWIDSSGARVDFKMSWTTGSQHTTMPGWSRLRRAGNVFTASQSADGVTWFTVGSSTIAMPTTYYVGFAASSGDTTNNTTETSRFDNVTPITGSSCQLLDVNGASTVSGALVDQLRAEE